MSHGATSNDYRWLVSDEGSRWLTEVGQWTEPLHVQADRLRRHLSPEQVHLVLEQWELRRRARRRFPLADGMFFTRQGLEQATAATLASYKATRFPPGMACYDLCCGIGGDLLALGARGEVVGVERDSVVACLAAANSRRLSPHTSRVLCQDVSDIALDPDIAVHIDPDRRPAGRRTVRLACQEPPADVVQRLLAPQAAAALKLAPATDPDDPLLAGAELEWIGQRRECQQLVAWFGAATRNPGRRVATLLESTGTRHSLVGDAAVAPLRRTAGVSRYLMEPHAVVLAAGLAGQLACELGAAALTPGGGYLTADTGVEHPLAVTFEVLETSVLRRKRLVDMLHRHHIGPLEIKVRGLELDPARWRASLRTDGDRPAVLCIARLQDCSVAILARRHRTAESGA